MSRVPEEQFHAVFDGLLELSSEALGGTVIACSDEFFAPAAALLRVAPAKSHKGTFAPTGAVFDGWETRRHSKSNDWALVKLAAPGRLHGMDVDTAHFNGNEAPMTIVKGIYSPDVEPAPEAGDWVELLPATPLGPSSRHLFELPKPTQPLTHILLYMLPDGGIARFRAYGTVEALVPLNRSCDLAAALYGGAVVARSDEHFGTAGNLILPGRGINMGDGWETARSRQPDHNDWVIIRLATPGRVDHVEIDTNHFVGNYPDTIELHALHSEQVPSNGDSRWQPLLPRTKLGPHQQHFFQVLPQHTPVTHVRLTIWPDGGVKRIRLVGRAAGSNTSPATMPTIAAANTLEPASQASQAAASAPRLPALPLSHTAFAPYGSIIEVADDARSTFAANRGGPRVTSVNFGTALKHNHLARAEAAPPHSSAPANLCIFASEAQTFGPRVDFEVKALERHEYSTQTFVPMGGTPDSARYLVLVALSGADGKPNFATLRAFVARPDQGISYHVGAWHHPLIAYNAPIKFFCVVHETGQKEVDVELLQYDEVKAVVYSVDH